MAKSSLASPSVEKSTFHGYTATRVNDSDRNAPLPPPTNPAHINVTEMNTPLLAPTGLMEVASVATNPVGKGGCPKCGRDVAGRALVMHLKTCHMNVPPPRQVDPFSDARNASAETKVAFTPPTTSQIAPSPMLASQLNHLGGQRTEVASTTSLPMEKPPSTHDEMGDPYDVPDEPQLPCPHCGRTFREKALQRHVGKCLKINKERKQFNAVAQALPAEAVKLHKDVERQEAKQAKKNKNCDTAKPCGQMPAWKAKSEAFRNAIKNARVVDQCIKEGKPLNQLPAFVPTAPELDDRTQCPHCGRKFGQLQAERHIPICPKGKGRGKGKR
jgi:hypothetical protein